ncbi:hypothetical protein PANT_6d00024 [Moesziomyces antarcticus T-34]|uniref:Uncharacterized protein n=1 Tax=Pseudozyma antarctica (strain T-34) TaxID=1151754 RepID=M9MAY1_PSEA3|nr:hypothetical protein PANT_6d00024 [Moesziomyces antarcticus T-34]
MPARNHLAAPQQPAQLARRSRDHVRRDLEEEVAAGAEDAIEIFEFPRVHDTSEQVHEHIVENNLTSADAIQKLRGERVEQTEQQLRYSRLEQQSGGSSQSSSSSSSASSSSSSSE